VPEGAFPSAVTIVPPLVDGGMSSANNATDVAFTTEGAALAGGPVSGAADLTFTESGGLSLQVQLAGDGTFTVTGEGGLALTIALSGDGTATITGEGGLAMIVPVAGDAPAAFTAAADLKGNLSLSGDITPFTELSPQNLASAVWNAVAAANNEPGSRGALMNGGAAGGLTTDQAQQLLEIFQRLGLDPTKPLVQSATEISTADWTLSVSEAAGTVTVERQ
jgi:hypothetical protein